MKKRRKTAGFSPKDTLVLRHSRKHYALTIMFLFLNVLVLRRDPFGIPQIYQISIIAKHKSLVRAKLYYHIINKNASCKLFHATML